MISCHFLAKSELKTFSQTRASVTHYSCRSAVLPSSCRHPTNSQSALMHLDQSGCPDCPHPALSRAI